MFNHNAGIALIVYDFVIQKLRILARYRRTELLLILIMY